jgi:serine/threonine-protein phosphatase 2A regulatory subunit B'
MDVDETLEGTGQDQDLYSGELQKFEMPAVPQFRRKSIIPVDETVLTELSRHRSLDEVLSMDQQPQGMAYD